MTHPVILLSFKKRGLILPFHDGMYHESRFSTPHFSTTWASIYKDNLIIVHVKEKINLDKRIWIAVQTRTIIKCL